jgi:hypothetical protein
LTKLGHARAAELSQAYADSDVAVHKLKSAGDEKKKEAVSKLQHVRAEILFITRNAVGKAIGDSKSKNASILSKAKSASSLLNAIVKDAEAQSGHLGVAELGNALPNAAAIPVPQDDEEELKETAAAPVPLDVAAAMDAADEVEDKEPELKEEPEEREDDKDDEKSSDDDEKSSDDDEKSSDDDEKSSDDDDKKKEASEDDKVKSEGDIYRLVHEDVRKKYFDMDPEEETDEEWEEDDDFDLEEMMQYLQWSIDRQSKLLNKAYLSKLLKDVPPKSRQALGYHLFWATDRVVEHDNFVQGKLARKVKRLQKQIDRMTAATSAELTVEDKEDTKVQMEVEST